jgi:hypothetical protein
VDTAIPNDRSAFSIASAAKRRASAAVIRHLMIYLFQEFKEQRSAA